MKHATRGMNGVYTFNSIRKIMKIQNQDRSSILFLVKALKEISNPMGKSRYHFLKNDDPVTEHGWRSLTKYSTAVEEIIIKPQKTFRCHRYHRENQCESCDNSLHCHECRHETGNDGDLCCYITKG
nr:hypothetical protein [Candidatus Sigynarchaeota archaeon]